jgi:type VI secretion system protein ImpK
MTVVGELQQQLALSRAAEAARQGELDRAAAMLAELDEVGPEVLDLLARIAAQQKRWDAADRYWSRVQELEPDDAAAAAGRETVAAILAGRRRARPVLPVVGAAAGVVAVAVLIGGVVRLGGDSAPVAQQSTPPATATATPAPTVDRSAQERADRLARQLAALEAQRRAAAAALAAQLDAIEAKVAGRGTVVQQQPGAVRILFEEGLFRRGAELTPAGREALDALGKRLAGLDVAITVTGHSVVVPGSSSVGGSGTALLRARTATQQLSRSSGLPLTTFTLQSGDQRAAPFRTAAQNRTVSLLLTPHRQ